MKTIKGVAIFTFFSILLGSCFSSPEFSVVPVIGFEDVVYKEGGGIATKDTLIVYISFKDGDGDLGLSSELIEEPYNDKFLYLENNGDTIPVPNYTPYSDIPPVLKVPEGAVGKLVTIRTRKQPEYSSFPEFVCPYEATAYFYDSVYVSEEDKDIFDESTHNLAKVRHSNGNNPDLYVLLDTFYYRRNPFHYNIDVEFWIQGAGNIFTLFDWRADLCGASDFNGRFPVLTDSENPLEGTLIYKMESSGFTQLFTGKVMKLKIRIRDRALHTSNTVESRVFTLENASD